MKVLITTDNTFTVLQGKGPEVGRRYVMEEADTATSEQGRAFHALLREFWRTGMHSYDVTTFDDFRDTYKARRGAGFEAFLVGTYDDATRKVIQTKYRTLDEIPAEIRKNQTASIFGRVKSWSDYTKVERSEAIDNLIADMHAAGVNTDKFEQILEGMGADR